MMTIEEAIKHCKDVALSCTNKECALEHFQLLKWLQEYSNILRKQDEQKHTDKVEPKFHEGDIVIKNTGFIGQILEVGDNEYILTGTGFIPFKYEHLWRRWTIQDAKEGDVLVCNGNVKGSKIKYERMCLFNNLNKAFFTLTKFSSNSVEEYGIDVDIDYPDNTVPATKEQKEILFLAMTNAGYTFDFEKKEFKKIEQNPIWSKEDERICQCLIRDQEKALDDVRNDKYGHSEIISDLKEMYRERIKWLESVKCRMQPQ